MGMLKQQLESSCHSGISVCTKINGHLNKSPGIKWEFKGKKLKQYEWELLTREPARWPGFEIRRILASNTLKSKWGLSTFLS